MTVSKRTDMPKWQGLLIRLIGVVTAIIITLTLTSIVVKDSPFKVIGTTFKGAFSLPWRLVYESLLLLGFGIAIVPAFKMKFWNMGANGQVLVGCLGAVLVMFYLSSKIKSNFVILILMLIASLICSIVWSVLPAIFKAFFNTNETLFTLMMNYIATCLVAFCNYVMAKGLRATPGIINQFENDQRGWIILKGLPPQLKDYFLPIIIFIILTVIVYFYINKTKHGYEVTVIGDSAKTAKYVGMNTKWITIRTLIFGGIITGIIGFLFASCVHHLVSADLCGSSGFTGVLIAWLSNFNPFIMAGVSFFLSFLTLGTSKVTSVYRLGSNDLSNIIIGLIFFAVLISEFFIRYKVRIKTKKVAEIEDVTKVEAKKVDTEVVASEDNANIDVTEDTKKEEVE